MSGYRAISRYVAVAWQAAAIALTLIVLSAHAAVSVLQSRGDAASTGANLAETELTPQTVGSGSFGKLASLQVEGFVYAQPLIAAGIQIAGKRRNVVYIATMENVVYAFDADDFSATGGLLWQVRFSEGGATPVPVADVLPATNPAYTLVKGAIGVMSTPVIDPSTHTIYVLSRWKAGDEYGQSLHALDLSSGAEKPNSPMPIVFTDASGISFDPKWHAQRTGLVIAGNKIVIAWGSIQDAGPYHGWVMAYDKASLALTGAFCTTCGPQISPVGVPYGGGFWQSGRAPVVDASGFVYLLSGNGWPTGDNGQLSGAGFWQRSCVGDLPIPTGYYGQSLIALDPNKLALLAPAASLLPANWCSELDQLDHDLGGSGLVLITENLRKLLIGGGKDGVLRLFDANALTSPEVVAGPQQQLQALQLAGPSGDCTAQLLGGPVYWNRASGKAGNTPNSSLVFVAAKNDYLRSFSMNAAAQAPLVPSAVGTSRINGHPGGILTLSANSNIPGSGIVWLVHADSPDCNWKSGALFDAKPATLRAYHADNGLQELWTSNNAAGRDAPGYFSKFTPATVANGKVYMVTAPAPESYPSLAYSYYAGTVYSLIQVYGLNPPASAPVLRNNAVLMAPIFSILGQ